ncbi:MAG: PLD nuclease N-terminal domain-containing protein, partial [Actinomycetota bacterium]
MPLLARGLPGLIVIGLLVYCVFDIISTEESRIQNLPKLIWLFVVIFIPLIGPLAWLLLGRPSNAELRPGGTRPRRSAPPPPKPITGLPERPPVS